MLCELSYLCYVLPEKLENTPNYIQQWKNGFDE